MLHAIEFASLLTLIVWLIVQKTKPKKKGWKPVEQLRRENKQDRQSSTYKAWRMAVLIRDNFTCQMCGKKGGLLEDHHLKPFAYFPELRFDVSNGQTLCHKDHVKTDSYGSKAKQNYGNK